MPDSLWPIKVCAYWIKYFFNYNRFNILGATMNELKKCPFCNSDDVDCDGWRSNDGRVGPACNNCGATAETIEIWNTRTADETIKKILAEIDRGSVFGPSLSERIKNIIKESKL